jgi:hypothetical protein
MGSTGHAAWKGEQYIRGFGTKPEGNRPLPTHRRGWEDNIKMDFQEIGWEFVDWIPLAQDTDQLRAVVDTVMNLQVP